jgi:hypothetical protein
VLQVVFNRDINTLRVTNFFDFEFEESWFESDFAKRLIKDVDKSDLIGPHLIQSPVLGPIPPHYLSGGVNLCF